MTQAATTRPGFLHELRDLATTVAVPHHEPPALIRRRRIVVVVVLAIGAALLGYSLTRPPGDESFYWLMLALAGVWAVGALASGPLHLGCVRFRGRNQRPVISGTVVGLVIGGLFLVGGLLAREIPGVREFVVSVLHFANFGPLALVVFITVVNGVAEELFFRGALYTALGKAYPAVVSTVIYVVAILASTGNPMLGVAAVIVGAVCAWERRATGGVLAPMLTHFFWGLVMVLALPPVFGV
jgi:CAAX protease family protein